MGKVSITTASCISCRFLLKTIYQGTEKEARFLIFVFFFLEDSSLLFGAVQLRLSYRIIAVVLPLRLIPAFAHLISPSAITT